MNPSRILALSALSAAITIGCAAVISCKSSVAPSAAPPTLSAVNPSSGQIGATVTVRGGGFDAANNAVKFGIGYVRGVSSSDGATLQFTVPSGLDLCAPDFKGPCPMAFPPVTPGDYAVGVVSRGGTSPTLTFTVTP